VDDVLERALGMFWERGYRATTTRELEKTLGIRQSSIYNAFGSKRELLLQAMDRYESRLEQELFAVLMTGDGYEALRMFFGEMVEWIHRNDYRGCLVVNLMATEVADPVLLERMTAYRRKIRSGMTMALGRVEGLLEADRTAQSEMLTAAVLGLHVTARCSVDPAEVKAMVAGIDRQIVAWSRALA
jgi:TetR/AcrR family transcriptional repressor of nem operon